LLIEQGERRPSHTFEQRPIRFGPGEHPKTKDDPKEKSRKLAWLSI
jgi:hypothetical protein